MGARRVLAAAVVAAAAALLGGCEGRGIYATLATEAPRANRDLNDELTVNSVVSAGGHYYAAAGGVWRRGHAQTNWRPVGRPRGGGNELRVLGLAAAGNTLCAGTEQGVFYAAAGERPSWRRAEGVAGAEQVQRVFAVPGDRGGTLLAFTITEQKADAHAYKVYSSADGCRTFGAVPGVPAAARPGDAAYAFGAYWLTAGAKLYRGETLDQLAEHSPQPDGGGGRYRGLFLNDAEDRLYVAGENDYVHFTTDQGAAWSKGKIEPPAGVSGAVTLTRFTQIDSAILVGTEAFGFYRFEDGSSPGGAVRGPRLTSQLYAAHVTGFARFGSGDDRIVFAATAGDGLSSIKPADTGGRLGTWDRE